MDKTREKPKDHLIKLHETQNDKNVFKMRQSEGEDEEEDQTNTNQKNK